jgi:Na+/H+ antiporter NhaD/arsenite permease-like protein
VYVLSWRVQSSHGGRLTANHFSLFVFLLFEKGLVEMFSELLLYGSPTPTSLLARVSVLSAVLGAFIMNDGAALFLSPIVAHICDVRGMDVGPFALALATR